MTTTTVMISRHVEQRLGDIERLPVTVPVMVLGAGFVDVIVAIPHLPERGGDLAAKPGRITIGGCGLNVVRGLHRLGVPVIPGIPVGRGPWADAVRQELTALGLSSPLQVESEDNGWCMAMVEPDGERTFVSIRGVETALSLDLLQRLTGPAGCLLYVSGYELLGQHSAVVLDWLNQVHPSRLLLDPGPRADALTPDILSLLGRWNPVVTVNEQEARCLCGNNQPSTVAEFANTWELVVICRSAAQGTGLYRPHHAPLNIPTRQVSVIDTIGAGDAHAAGLLAALACGWNLPSAVWLGNQVAAISVSRPGADGTPTFAELRAAVGLR